MLSLFCTIKSHAKLCAFATLSLLIIIGIIQITIEYILSYDSELKRLEKLSDEMVQHDGDGYGTYDSFLHQLLNAKRLFYVMPPYLASTIDEFDEVNIGETGIRSVITKKRSKHGCMICDVDEGTVDPSDNATDKYFERVIHIRKVLGWTTIDLAVIIWVPIREGIAAMYFVDRNGTIIRKEIFRYL